MAAASMAERPIGLLVVCVTVILRVAAAQDLPACTWSKDDKNCAAVTIRDRFVVAPLGVKVCPAGSSIINDVATCREAAATTGFPMDESAAFGPREGGICYWCGGCNPKSTRLISESGPLAKYICVKDGTQSSPAVAAPAGNAPAAKAAGTAWPECQEQSTVIRNAGQALFANLQGYGATIGCFLDDCLSTDKFVAGEIESCTKVCHTLPECKYWVWGVEEGENKCWFRTGDSGREFAEGWIAGSRTCMPAETQVLELGNNECWAPGFGYNECCDEKYGPNGNAQCWDGVYNYDRCCFPIEEL